MFNILVVYHYTLLKSFIQHSQVDRAFFHIDAVLGFNKRFLAQQLHFVSTIRCRLDQGIDQNLHG